MSESKHITNEAAYAEFKKGASNLFLGKAKPFIAALWRCFDGYKDSPHDYRLPHLFDKEALRDHYKSLCGKSASSCATVDEFFCPALLSCLKTYFGKDETQRIIEECRLIMECPYSHSTYRPSYRSARAGDYAERFFSAMIYAIYYRCCGFGSVLHTKSTHRSALDLRNNDADTFAAVEEAITGDNTAEAFSHAIIYIIVKSGNQRALDLLGKLLLAAKAQEGLRQAILEACDSGTINSHLYFMKLILDNGLCRFSSVIRAFDTWCGLSYGDQKQKTVEKMMALSIELLADDEKAQEALQSNDTTTIYMGLWTISVKDVHAANDLAVSLLASPEKYRRLTGWYFIYHTNHDEFRHHLAMRFLEVRDLEELAWVAQNIKVNHSLNGYYGYGKDTEKEEKETVSKTYPVDFYPSTPKDRALLFERAAAAAEFIGKKNSSFTPSVFPWYGVTLTAAPFIGLLLGLAAYDRKEELIIKCSQYLKLMDSDQRLRFYINLLNPKISTHRALLFEGLNDKSINVKETIIKRLKYYPLAAAEADTLAQRLSTNSASLRLAINTLLEHHGYRQPDKPADDKLTPENGFGLFDPNSEMFDVNAWVKKRPFFHRLSDEELRAKIVPGSKEMFALYDRLLQVWLDNKDYEYETASYSGGKEM